MFHNMLLICEGGNLQLIKLLCCKLFLNKATQCPRDGAQQRPLVSAVCRYRAFTFALTFLLYTCFHLSRKPISIVKVTHTLTHTHTSACRKRKRMSAMFILVERAS